VLGDGFRPFDQNTSYVAQWARAAHARSQYSDGAGAAAAALGRPDAASCGAMDARSWMPAVGTTVPDWLELRFDVPVRAWRWHVYMSARPEVRVRVRVRVRARVRARVRVRVQEP